MAQLEEIFIPENVLQSKRYFGFRQRNIIEGVLITALIVFLITLIPFVKKIKIIICIVVGFGVFVACCAGIKGFAPTELIMLIIQDSKMGREYHLRSVKYAEKKTNFKISENGEVYSNQSFADKFIRFAKENIGKIKR